MTPEEIRTQLSEVRNQIGMIQDIIVELDIDVRDLLAATDPETV